MDIHSTDLRHTYFATLPNLRPWISSFCSLSHTDVMAYFTRNNQHSCRSFQGLRTSSGRSSLAATQNLISSSFELLHRSTVPTLSTEAGTYILSAIAGMAECRNANGIKEHQVLSQSPLKHVPPSFKQTCSPNSLLLSPPCSVYAARHSHSPLYLLQIIPDPCCRRSHRDPASPGHAPNLPAMLRKRRVAY
jgi:hypothetical protein